MHSDDKDDLFGEFYFRPSTWILILSVCAWLVLLFLAYDLDRSFESSVVKNEDAVTLASNWRFAAWVFFFVAVLAGLAELYMKLLRKPEGQIVFGDSIVAGPGAVVGARSSTVNMGTIEMIKYQNSGQVGAFGDHARSDTNQFIQQTTGSSIDLKELTSQLATMRREMKRLADPDNAEHDEAIGAIASAEKAARSGDQSSAVKFLKGAGKWALGIAAAVSAELVKDLIEGHL